MVDNEEFPLTFGRLQLQPELRQRISKLCKPLLAVRIGLRTWGRRRIACQGDIAGGWHQRIGIKVDIEHSRDPGFVDDVPIRQARE